MLDLLSALLSYFNAPSSAVIKLSQFSATAGLMRVFHQTNQAAAARYYTELSEYYGPGKGSRGKGVYFGRGAEFLELTPSTPVTEQAFSALCNNRNPFSGERLTARDAAKRRVLTDVTLSVPKEVSLLWAATEDSAITDLVQRVALETAADIEEDAQTRVNHRRGEMTLAPSRSVVGVAWLHTTSRPVDSSAPDPNLHVHLTFLNATRTDDGRWTALDLSKAVKSSRYHNAMFLSRLARGLQELGYPVARNEINFTVPGISRDTVTKFSRRTTEILAEAKAKGILHRKDWIDQLGAQTRKSKGHSHIPQDELHEVWRSRLTSEELGDLQVASTRHLQPTPTALAAKQAVDHCILHRFERQSVVEKRSLLADALLHSIGQATPDQVRDELERRDWVVGEDPELLSTQQVLDQERRVVAYARAGRGQVAPFVSCPRLPVVALSDEQKRAVVGLVSSSDRVQVLTGVAGSGKTRLMSTAIDLIESAGSKVTVLAPTAEAAHGVLREQEGFDANTLASFLIDERAQRRARGGALWIDEAGLVSLPDMDRLFKIADTIVARVILSGDPMQHQPVALGQPLHQIVAEAGVQPHIIRTIRRQQNDIERAAAEAFSRHDTAEGLDKLISIGRVHDIADDREREHRLATDYADAIGKGEEVLVLSPSHADRRRATAVIREEQKARKQIDGEQERTFTVLQSRRLTAAQRSDPASYAPDDVLEFHRNAAGGLRTGSRVTVAAVRDGQVWAAQNDRLVPLPIDAANSFEVYRTNPLQLAPGDLVRITKNRHGKDGPRLNNGSLLKLTGFTETGRLRFGNGLTLDPAWGHVDSGICLTSFASQGKTATRTMVYQTSASVGASDAAQAYVSASRNRERIDWYTDDLAELRHAIARERPTLTASDLAASAPPTRRRTLVDRAQDYARELVRRFQITIALPEPQYAR